MVTSNRERLVVIGVGVVLVLWILNSFVYDPYMAERQKAKDAIAAADKTIRDNETLKVKNKRLAAQYDQMLKDGMKTVPAEAANQLERSVRDWALLSKVTPTETKLDQMPPEKDYQRFKFHFAGTGSERSLNTMLWAIETSPLPVRLDDISVSSIKDGIDSLKMELDVIVLCPLNDKTPRTTVASATGAL